MNQRMMFTRSVKGLPSTVLLILFATRRTMALSELVMWADSNDDDIRKAVKTLGPDGLGLIAISVRERGEKFVCLAEASQQMFPGFNEMLPTNDQNLPIPESDKSDSGIAEVVENGIKRAEITPESDLSDSRPLSSSSNLTLTLDSKSKLITTTTSEAVPEKSDSEISEQVEQVKRILEATPILFGEPGVFLKGLTLETIYPEVALGWVKQGLNAKNLPLSSRAGIVYNGLKNGEKPKPAFLYGDNSILPHDYRVEIGLATKDCELCGDEFASLKEYTDHFKICVKTAKPIEPEPEPEAAPYNVPDFENSNIGQAWQKIISELQTEMPRASFDTWVRDAQPIDWDDAAGFLSISVRNAYAKDWLETRLLDTLIGLLSRTLERNIQVRFLVDGKVDE